MLIQTFLDIVRSHELHVKRSKQSMRKETTQVKYTHYTGFGLLVLLVTFQYIINIPALRRTLESTKT